MSAGAKANSGKDIDLLALVAEFALGEGLSLDDPALASRFAAAVEPRIAALQIDRNLLFGSRAERLFEAMTLSLGRTTLLKVEDVGRVHCSDECRAPDFRLVLDDGGQWLVEVKSIHARDPSKQIFKASGAYLKSLLTYSELVGTPLKLAIYWSIWNLWSVIDPTKFINENGSLRVTLQESLLANEIGRLGDMFIATKAPLRLVLEGIDDLPASAEDQTLERIRAAARFFSDKVELTDPQDRQLAYVLLFFGNWRIEGPRKLAAGAPSRGIEIIAFPEETNEPDETTEQDLVGIGLASHIFTSYYNTQTVDGAAVIGLQGAPVPHWFAPLGKWDFKSSKLPLILGRLAPWGS